MNTHRGGNRFGRSGLLEAELEGILSRVVGGGGHGGGGGRQEVVWRHRLVGGETEEVVQHSEGGVRKLWEREGGREGRQENFVHVPYSRLTEP